MQTLNKKTFDGVNRRKFLETETFATENSIQIISLKYSGLKMIGVGILSVALLVSLSFVGGTVSYYADEENSVGSKLLTSPLNFDVEIASSTSAQVSISEGGELLVPYMFPLVDSKEIQYSVNSTFVSGDLGLCSSIKALGAFPFPYDGNLIGLQTGFSTQTGSWALTFSVPDISLFSGATCTVDMVYKGWNKDSVVGEGYSDVQKVTITFTTPEIIAPVQFRESSALVENPEVPTESVETPVVEDEVLPTETAEVVEESTAPVETEVVEAETEPIVPEVLPEPTPEVTE